MRRQQKNIQHIEQLGDIRSAAAEVNRPAQVHLIGQGLDLFAVFAVSDDEELGLGNLTAGAVGDTEKHLVVLFRSNDRHDSSDGRIGLEA